MKGSLCQNESVFSGTVVADDVASLLGASR